MSDTKRIDEIAQSETAAFQAEQSCKFIECAANLAATTMHLHSVARYLRELADQIEEHG